ncbi:MAG: hypothetical protein HN742_32925 [Lentisphaerae bacterium]|jgi:hypothetical protein|nr:hypothetical protein [Lentisphaerota bacterium]MBT4817778.1 hypothetical protein [Lentisphaerota bacterium]MBT5610887.1 hypothetical protein [Lentisphaerota bacterium]MBT7060654.1 hypothetical protein [Lentisphaerota bacterium]MBT7846721.1 hypothetical protein [Lentisphaerota bacterium]
MTSKSPIHIVIAVSLTCAALFPLPSQAGSAYLQHTQKRTETDGERHLVDTFRLANTLTEYEFTYDITMGPETPEGKCFSTQWVYSIGVPSLGMTAPVTCNWYSQGFIDLQIDGESLKDYPATVEPLRRGGPDAACSATWKTAKGTVRLIFLLRADDDRLLVRSEWETATPPSSVSLKMLNYPCYFYGSKDRWITTATREVQNSQTVELDPATEPWLFCHDKGTARDHGYGGCAAMAVPEELVSATAEITAYPIWVTFRFRPESGHATVALWDFAETSDNAANIAYLKKSTPTFVDDLRSAAEADWSNPSTAVDILPTVRRNLFNSAREFEPTPYDTFTSEVATPHQRWAKPLDGGPVRILVIAPTWSQRETVELSQRLDVKATTFSVSRRDVLFDKRWLMLYDSYRLYGYKPRNVVSVLGDLANKLQEEYDCIVIGDVKRDILPDYFVDAIAEKVRAGTGLVATGMGRTVAADILGKNSQPLPFRALLPIEALPGLRDFGWQEPKEKGLLTRAATVGSGRILQMNHAVASNLNLSLTPHVSHEYDYVPADYEYSQALIAKAVLWAAQRQPAAEITDLTMDSVRVALREPVPAAGLDISVHDRDGRVEFEQKTKVNLKGGDCDVPLDLVLRRAGKHFLDVTLRRPNGDVIDWASIAFDTTAPAAIGGIQLETTVLVPGAPLTGKVSLHNTPPQSRLLLAVTDAYERVLATQVAELAPGASAHPFSVSLAEPLCAMHRIDATLVDAKGDLDWAQAEFTIPNRELDNFTFLMWSSAPNNWTQSAVNRTLAAMGVDSLDMPGLTGASTDGMNAACRNAAWTALRPIPYITRIASKQGTGLVRKPCLTDPIHLKRWTDGLRERAQAAAPYGPIAYTLGDENFLVTAKLDICQSPTCLASFRASLKKQYEDLAALNTEWGTAFADWNDVTPTTFAEAKESGQHARWVDHRLYMDGVLTQAHALGRQAIQESDPGARVGFDGVFSLNSWHGYDFYQLCRACDLNQVYCSRLEQIEYLRSFQLPNAMLGAWHNRVGNKDEISAKRVPWHLLLNGFNSSWYWMAYRTGPAALFPDLRPTPQMEWMAESHAEIKAGIGELLMGAERLGDGIAIHYSQASVHGGTLLERPLDKAHRGAMLAIEDLGLQYDFVSYEQIEKGALEDYRAFVMPASCALSTKETAAIKTFVKAGGLLIADVYPGIMNGHCRTLATAALDDVFGCVVTEAVPTIESDTPVAFHNRAFGLGQATLLNCPFNDYETTRTDGNELPFREALRQTLGRHGIRSAVEVTQAQTGARLSACETVRFRDGHTEYIAVVKDDDIIDHAPVKAKIQFPANRHAFDVRRKRHLGRTQSIEKEIVPGVPELFALLPYRVRRLELPNIPSKCVPGQSINLPIRLAAMSPGVSTGRHMVRLEVTNPAGKPVPHYARNVELVKGAGKATMAFAFNDPPGTWTLTATDVATNESTRTKLTLVAPGRAK